ncbi:MAG: restriction endonuclease subunit S [Spirochaetia bacterium]|nr:restriction endonuclease subunit S [Spirochaetia bacterium]
MKEMRKLGDFVQPVDVRNTDLSVTRLLGLSINKCFIESIANTIGTDFRPYKIVKKGQFAYGPVTSRNGEKITIALLEEPECIISSSYAVFEITDTSKLLPEYLMLWFSRPEFDRYARYKSHGSVREIFDWDEMCRVELPVPDIKEQQKIVDTYNAITNRIRIKQKINENLEKTAQCLFEKYFSKYNNFYENKNELLDLPKEWKYAYVGDFCKSNMESISSRLSFDSVQYLDTGNITNNKIEELQILSVSDDLPSRAKRIVKDTDIIFSTVRPNLKHYGILYNPAENMIVSTGFAVLHNTSNIVSNEFLYMWITNEKVLTYLQSIAENSVSTYPSINADDITNIKIVIPSNEILIELTKVFKQTYIQINYNNQEISRLNNFRELLIAQISKR